MPHGSKLKISGKRPEAFGEPAVPKNCQVGDGAGVRPGSLYGHS